MAVSNDIFNRRALAFGGAFAADSARIELDLTNCQGLVEDDDSDLGNARVGLLTQQFNVNYQQPITRLYEVGTQLTYYVAGRPQGTANIARVLGPGTVMSQLYACWGDVCQANANDLCFCIQANCIGNTDQGFDAMRIGLKNVVLQSLGFSIQAQDMVINEQLGLFFTALMTQDAADGCQVTGDDTVEAPNCFEA